MKPWQQKEAQAWKQKDVEVVVRGWCCGVIWMVWLVLFSFSIAVCGEAPEERLSRLEREQRAAALELRHEGRSHAEPLAVSS